MLSHIFTVTLPRLRKDASRLVKIDAVIGLEARGFLFGPQLAQRLGAQFLPVRKKGKLPGECVQAEYEKEYGKVSKQKFAGRSDSRFRKKEKREEFFF